MLYHNVINQNHYMSEYFDVVSIEKKSNFYYFVIGTVKFKLMNIHCISIYLNYDFNFNVT